MNAYALVCPASGRSVLVDPGAEPDALHAMLHGSRPIAILLTHTHPDHIGALAEMRNRLGVPLWAHPGPHHNRIELDVDRMLADGETVVIGTGALHIQYAPGHCADQICCSVLGGDAVLGGDTLFAGGPGKTWSPEGFQTTLRTLREVVLGWPDRMTVYPGHGPSFRLGDLRGRIEAFLDRAHPPAFFGDAVWE
jgi:hydroxyacylglutathione hydrolase